ncbi:hypothetical protein CY0110_19457 [Crocosphaera chwakensis CCY0110]|uniref:Uncharacterized protein n=1 Tax=Crocosphaera chwakensis CCY0110 TaxID=391612 RepID=A3IJM3_9CHRO|nr:hypothetical protein CY0110_19457 [Crocosphaera chwakensis CCY0110]
MHYFITCFTTAFGHFNATVP